MAPARARPEHVHPGRAGRCGLRPLSPAGVALPAAHDAVSRRRAHPAAHRWRSRNRVVRRGIPAGPLRRPGRGLGGRRGTAGDRARCRAGWGAGSRIRRVLLGQRRAGQRLPGLPAGLQAPAHRDRLLQRRAAQDEAARRAARDRSGSGGRPLRHQDDRGPLVEGPPGRVHVHRVRTLPGGVSGVGHGQAAQSQDDDHGHP